MMTPSEYENLWISGSPFGFGQHLDDNMPIYDHYVEREHMLADYIDIFRGFNSRGDRAVRPIEFPESLYQGPHPFEDLIKKNDKPEIQYVLIGEAAPPRNPLALQYDKNGLIIGDTNNSFFYDVMAVKPTGYLIAPLTAFGISGKSITNSATKIDRLYQLAKKGVILLDLFPFAVNYDSFRDRIISSSILSHFYSASVHYSLVSRVTALSSLFCSDKPCSSVLIAPPKISHTLASSISMPIGPSRLLNLPYAPLHFSKNGFGLNIIPKSNNFYFTWNDGWQLNSEYEKPKVKKKKQEPIKRAPIYRCCAYSGAGTVPHELFIRNGLGII